MNDLLDVVIQLACISSNCQIKGNEIVDAVAKSPSSLSIDVHPVEDLQRHFYTFEWQQQWSSQPSEPLTFKHKIQGWGNTIGEIRSSNRILVTRGGSKGGAREAMPPL